MPIHPPPSSTPPAQGAGGAGGGTEETVSPEEFLERLRKALQRDGDFPASAKVVNELKQLTTDPRTTANQVAEVILREPSLGARVLHLVNSAFNRRAKPIMTVSQAVIQIGMKPLGDLCSSLVLLQKFVPAARRGGSFAICLQRLLVTSLLSSSLAEKSTQGSPSKNGESGYLAGSLLELGVLLMAYYFPQLYESALKRAEAKRQPLATGIKEVTGLTPTQISLEVVNALNLPDMYKEVLRLSAQGVVPLKPHSSPTERLANCLFAAHEVSDAVVSQKSKQQVDAVLARVAPGIDGGTSALGSVLGELTDMFQEHCASLDLSLPVLPEFVANYGETETAEAAAEGGDNADPFAQYLDELRQSVNNGEPSASIITSVMETLAWGLKFDRVLLLLVAPGKRALGGRMALGATQGLDVRALERPLHQPPNPFAPDEVAFLEGRAVFNGDPVLEGGWPLVALPIGFGQKAIGVIYADRINSDEEELSSAEQAAIGVLTELLDRSIGSQK